MGVVDALEVVQIEHDKRKFFASALLAGHGVLHQFDHVPPVVQAGQFVANRNFFQACQCFGQFRFLPVQLVREFDPLHAHRHQGWQADHQQCKVVIANF